MCTLYSQRIVLQIITLVGTFRLYSPDNVHVEAVKLIFNTFTVVFILHHCSWLHPHNHLPSK